MTIIAFISQKGGVGKSTLARALATEATHQGVTTLLADCDPQQETSYEWSKLQKKINCQVFKAVKDIWPLSKKYELIIIDAPARSSEATLEIARQADLVVQPVGSSRDDLIPAAKLFNALIQEKIDKKKLLFALTRLSTNKESEAIKDYLNETGYRYTLSYLYEKASYKQTQNEGLAITEVSYKTLARQAKELINELLNNL